MRYLTTSFPNIAANGVSDEQTNENEAVVERCLLGRPNGCPSVCPPHVTHGRSGIEPVPSLPASSIQLDTIGLVLWLTV
jgi:hypothetical protein